MKYANDIVEYSTAKMSKPISQIYTKWNTSVNLPHIRELSGLTSIGGLLCRLPPMDLAFE